jgi:tungstate transport system ATP-binding protein
MLSLQGIRHQYSGRSVVDLDNFTLPKGEVSALVGPNGCGKSTLLRIMALLEKPDEGFVSIRGIPVQDDQSRRKLRGAVTLVEQRPFLFKGTVTSNLEYALGVNGSGASNRAERARDALKRLDITHLADKDAAELSEGEKQITAIARAVSLRPDVLLLDEPTSAADRSTAGRVHTALADEAARGATVLFTSHHLQEAFRWADIVSAMQDGNIKGAAPENLFRCQIPEGKPGHRTLDLGPLSLQVVTDLFGLRTLVIPAKDIVLSRTPLASSARNQLTGKVIEVRDDGPLGVSVVVDTGVDLTVRITLQSLQEMGISLGSEVVLSIKATAVQIF